MLLPLHLNLYRNVEGEALLTGLGGLTATGEVDPLVKLGAAVLTGLGGMTATGEVVPSGIKRGILDNPYILAWLADLT